MNNEQANIAVAESVGWKRHADGVGWYKGEHPKFRGGSDIPDYGNDLNAMHEVIDALSYEDYQLCCAFLGEIIERDGQTRFTVPAERRAINATASQRREAYLRTKGLWK